MATLIRIEKNGTGIFRHRERGYSKNKIVQRVWDRHNGKFPTPYEDGLKMNNKMFCAYNSLELMREWVTDEELKFFISKEFQVFVIEVSTCQQGKYQSIFERKNIKTITNISDLFTN